MQPKYINKWLLILLREGINPLQHLCCVRYNVGSSQVEFYDNDKVTRELNYLSKQSFEEIEDKDLEYWNLFGYVHQLHQMLLKEWDQPQIKNSQNSPSESDCQ